MATGHQFSGSIPDSRYYVQNESQGYQVPMKKMKIQEAGSRIVDKAKLVTLPDDRVSVGDEIVLYRQRDDLKLWGGTMRNPKKGSNSWTLEVLGYANELNTTRIVKAYKDTAPEDIIADLINNHSSLSFQTTMTSNVTLKSYVANGYIRNAIDDMLEILGGQVRTDESKTLHLEESGAIDNGKTLEKGVNCHVEEMELDTSQLVNKVRVKGGKSLYRTDESFNPDGNTKEYDLQYAPVGNIRVTVDGIEQKGGIAQDISSGEDFYIDAEDSKMIFDTAPIGSSGEISYSYEVPVVVEAEANDSPLDEEVSKEVKRNHLKTFADAREFAREYLATYSKPLPRGKLQKELDHDLSVNELVRVKDPFNGVNQKLVIQGIKWEFPKGEMKIEVGADTYNVYDWQSRVQQRIKELEKQLSTEQRVTKYLQFPYELDVSLTKTIKVYKRDIGDSFLLNNASKGELGTAKLGDDRGSKQLVYEETQ